MPITALTPIGGVSVTLTLTDESLKTSNTSVYVPDTTTLAQAQAFALALAQAVESVTDAQVVRANVNASFDCTGADPAVKGNTVEEKAVFALKTAVGKIAQVSIPSINLAYRTDGTRVVDLTNAAITTITTLLTTGDGAVAPVDSNGQDLVEVVSGKIRKRNSLD